MKKLLVFVVLLAVGAGAAYHFGYLERLGSWWPRTRLIPKDPALLAYFGPDTRELMLVQATELDFRLSGESREKFEREVKDFQTKTGIDTRRDVDAVATTLGFGVVRGYFDWKRLSAWLQSEGYTLTELGGVPAAVKPQSADVALDGRYLLIGPRGELERALSRKRRDQGLGNDSPLVRALDEAGWKHAVVGGMVSGSPMLALLGAVGPQAQSLLTTIDPTPEGIELRGTADTGSKLKADVLRATLEVMRKTLLLGTALDSSPDTRPLRDALEAATLESDDQGRVRGTLRLPATLADEASASLARAQLPSALQNLGQPFKNEDPPPPGSPPPPPYRPRPLPRPWPPPRRPSPWTGSRRCSGCSCWWSRW